MIGVQFRRNDTRLNLNLPVESSRIFYDKYPVVCLDLYYENNDMLCRYQKWRGFLLISAYTPRSWNCLCEKVLNAVTSLLECQK